MNVVNRIASGNKDLDIDVASFAKAMTERMDSTKQIDPKAVMDNLMLKKIQMEARRAQASKHAEDMVTNLKARLEDQGVKMTQKHVDELLLSELSRASLGQGVSNSLESQMNAIRGLVVHQYDKLIENTDGFDVNDILTNSDKAVEIFTLIQNGGKSNDKATQKVVSGVRKIMADMQTDLVREGLLPESAIGSPFEGHFNFDAININDLQKSGELDGLLDEIIDFDLIEKNIKSQKNDELYSRIQKESYVKRNKEVIHHEESAEMKNAYLSDRLQKNIDRLEANKQKLSNERTADQKLAVEKKITKINEAQAKKTTDIENKIAEAQAKIAKDQAKLGGEISPEKKAEIAKRIETYKASAEKKKTNIKARIELAEKKVAENQSHLTGKKKLAPARLKHVNGQIAKAKKSVQRWKKSLSEVDTDLKAKIDKANDVVKPSQKKHLESIIANNKKYIGELKSRLKEVSGETKDRITKAREIKDLDPEDIVKIQKQIDKNKARIEKIGLSKEEVSKNLKERQARETSMLEEFFGDQATDVFDRAKFKSELVDSILKNGYISDYNALGIVKIKADKMPLALEKLSMNQNINEHFKSAMTSYAGRVAKNKKYGSNVSGGIQHYADELAKHAGFAPSEKIVQTAKNMYDPRFTRNGLPSRAVRVLQAARFWGNNTVLGRAVLAMAGENAHLGASVAKFVGGNKLDVTLEGLKNTVGSFVGSVAGNGPVLNAQAENFLIASSSMANILPKFHDKLHGRNGFSRWIEKSAQRLSGMQSVDLSQRALGMGKIMSTLDQLVLTGKEITPELRATLDQFGFTLDDMASIKEAGGWGSSRMLDYAEKNFIGNKDALYNYRQLALKQETYLDQMASRILARNNDRVKLKTGFNVGSDFSGEFQKTVLQYKQIIYEVADNLRALGVEGDGYSQTVEMMSLNFFQAGLRVIKNPDVAYTVAVSAALNFAAMEARRNLNGEFGWMSEDYNGAQLGKDVLTSLVSATGGFTLGFEDLLSGDFDAGGIALDFAGPTSRHVMNTLGLVGSIGKNVFSDGKADNVSKTLGLMRQMTPLKTHIGTGQAIQLFYEFLNKSVNDDYSEFSRKRRSYMSRRGAESWLYSN